MIRDFFTSIYETLFGITEGKYTLIFSTLFENGSYVKLGLLFVIIPVISWLIFYYAWNYPYARYWHWILWFIFSGIIVFISSWSLAHSEIFGSNNQELIDALNDPQSGYMKYASDLPLVYATINTISALILGFIYSLIMKQRSKIQMHLPF